MAERSKRGHERQARLFGYDSELNLCELSHILPSDGQPLSSQQAQAEPLRRYDAAGRVSQIGQNQYRYDKCGRLSEKVVSRPGFRPQTTQFEWDGFDRLQRVILPDGSRWRYRFDPFGWRIGKEREGQVSQLTAITRIHYRWDGDQLVQQHKMKSYIKLSDLILAIKNRDFDQGSFFCLYSKDSMKPLESNSLCFIDEYPQEGAEGEDVFPSDVIKNDLELCYYGEQFIDVINNVISQINEPQVSAFVEALNYYMDNDDFLDIR